MVRKRDLFDDTTMTFGEHLEVLRVHVWKSLIGIVIGVVVSMFIGDKIIGILKAPIDKALRDAKVQDVKDDLKEVSLMDYFKSLFDPDKPAETQDSDPSVTEPDRFSDTVTVQVQIEDLVKAVRRVAPDLIANDVESAGDAPPSNIENNDENSKLAPHILLPIRSPEFAMFKRAAGRSDTLTTLRVEEAFMSYLKIALVAGLMLASPWVFYQIWEFVAAGLYHHERKYVHIYLPMSIGLFVSGALFCFYFVFPLVLSFLIGFSRWMDIVVYPRLTDYINLALMLPLMFGISFQLPLVMLFLERIGVVTTQTYTENWRMAILVMSVVSMLLTPSDPGSMLLMLLPLIVLYVGGIQLCRMKPRAEADPLA